MTNEFNYAEVHLHLDFLKSSLLASRSNQCKDMVIFTEWFSYTKDILKCQM